MKRQCDSFDRWNFALIKLSWKKNCKRKRTLIPIINYLVHNVTGWLHFSSLFIVLWQYYLLKDRSPLIVCCAAFIYIIVSSCSPSFTWGVLKQHRMTCRAGSSSSSVYKTRDSEGATITVTWIFPFVGGGDANWYLWQNKEFFFGQLSGVLGLRASWDACPGNFSLFHGAWLKGKRAMMLHCQILNQYIHLCT